MFPLHLSIIFTAGYTAGPWENGKKIPIDLFAYSFVNRGGKLSSYIAAMSFLILLAAFSAYVYLNYPTLTTTFGNASDRAGGS